MARNKPAPRAPIRPANVVRTQPGNPEAQLPNVAYVRPEVSDMRPKWELMVDALEGQCAIKGRGVAYLPMPRVEEQEEQEKRYAVYLERAIFYNATRRTMDGLMGEVFSRQPVVAVPDSIKDILTNIDGAGVSHDQLTKKALSFNMGMGRGAFFTDFPEVPEGVTLTVADRKTGKYRPTVELISPMNIINWATDRFGSLTLFTKVVIASKYIVSSDGFEKKYDECYKVMALVGGIYHLQEWRKKFDEKTGSLLGYYLYRETVPLANGSPMEIIPFCPFGCIDNNEFPDNPPLYDLAILNIGHYRNSADYEESCFVCGQPTVWFSGLTQEWVDDVFKGRQVYLGSRGIIPLPLGAQAGMLQIAPNSMPKEAMDQKENQMAAIGAKLVKSDQTERTLGEAQIDNTASSSILAAAANNVSAAMTRALQFAVQFEDGTVADPDVKYSLNTDFPSARLTPNERAELMLEWQGGAIGFKEMRNGLRRAGVATEPDEDIKAEGEAMAEKNQANALALKTTASQGGGNDPKLNQGSGGGNQAGS